MIRTSMLVIGLALTQAAAAQCGPCAQAYADATFLTVGVSSQNVTFAIRARTDRPLIAQTLMIFTNGTDGDVAIWSHDPVTLRPKAELATAVWSSTSSAPAWKGAVFSRPAILLANTDFWVVLRVTQVSASPSLRARSTTGQDYCFSRDRGKTWSQVYGGFEWKYRVHCCRLDNLASFSPYGSGCGPSARGAPEINATLPPRSGVSFDVTVANARPNAVAALALGASDVRWGSIALPLDLRGAGAPNCFVLAAFDTLFGAPVSSGGNGSLRFSLPNSQSLIGLQFYSQWLIFDSTANALGITLTPAAHAIIGP